MAVVVTWTARFWRRFVYLIMTTDAIPTSLFSTPTPKIADLAVAASIVRVKGGDAMRML